MSRADLTRDIDLARGMLGEWGQIRTRSRRCTLCLEPSRPARPYCDHGNKHRGGSYEEDYDINGTCYKVFFAGPKNDVGNRNHHGVALDIKATRWAKWKGQWEPVSSRIVTARIHNEKETTLIVGAYAPTEVSEEQMKD